MKMLLLMVLVLPMPSVEAAGDLTGPWKLELKPDFSGHPAIHDCTFTQDRQTLTIDCGGQKMSGAVKGANVKFQHKAGKQNQATAVYSGNLEENDTIIKGVWSLTPDNREGRFEARKQSRK